MDHKKSAKLTIRKVEEFNQLLDCIHDEYFDIADIKYNENEKIIEVPYRKIFHNGPSRIIKNRIIYRTVEVDVLRCLLRIKNVENYTIIDEANIGVYSFNKLEYHEKLKQLIFTCSVRFPPLVGQFLV